MKAHLRKVRISPKKANIVAGLIRGKKASEALTILKFAAKKPADSLYKVLHSAMANAQNNDGVSAEDLTIASVIINKGPFYKRGLPSTRGRMLPIKKPTTHITIELQKLK